MNITKTEIIINDLLNLRLKYKPISREYGIIMRAVRRLEKQEELIKELYERLEYYEPPE